MNIVFFGSAEFAVPSLKAILGTKHRISCVVTQPNRQKGRGLIVADTAIKKAAQEAGLKVYQPQDINQAESIQELNSLNPDLFVVIAYGQILSEKLLAIPKIFSLNLHASLLPKYRGAAPINWAIINGEDSTGVTAMKMVRQMDAGPLLAQEKTNITSQDSAITLEEKLSHLGAGLVLSCLNAIEKGKYDLVEQDGKKSSFAPKLKKEDGCIKWDAPALAINNLIRGCVAWPGAFTYYRGKLLKIHKAKIIQPFESKAYKSAGQIAEVSQAGIFVITGKDVLIIEQLQIEGKRIMSVKEFISGHNISAGDILGDKK